MTIIVKDANGNNQTVKVIDDLAADGGQITIGTKADAPYAGGGGSASLVALLKGLYNSTTALVRSFYASPNGNSVLTHTTLDSLFSDDFGGSAVSSTGWTAIDGGLAANPNLGNGALTQAKIGSGITGITDSVSGSALTVSMNTTLGAERWYLSNQVFAGKEDILVILSKSQALAANSIFIGLVEVDPTTLVPLLNPNFAADGNGSGEFTNRGGCEFGLSATATAYQAEAIGDSSSLKAVGVTGVAAAWSTTQECLIEIDSRDITVSTASVDSTAAKAAGASRVSTQCPNDKRLYKLLMRFKNPTAPASNTTVTIQRIIVVDNYEQRVQVSTGEGDSIGQKGVPTNVVNTPTVTATLTSAANAMGRHKLFSAATTNATSVKASAGKLVGGVIANMTTSVRYFKLYNKASAPTVGTDTPVYTFPLQPNTTYYVADMIAMLGDQFAAGIAYAITGGLPDSDTTAIAANDVAVNLAYF
jgi:hypothetical protein